MDVSRMPDFWEQVAIGHASACFFSNVKPHVICCMLAFWLYPDKLLHFSVLSSFFVMHALTPLPCSHPCPTHSKVAFLHPSSMLPRSCQYSQSDGMGSELVQAAVAKKGSCFDSCDFLLQERARLQSHRAHCMRRQTARKRRGEAPVLH